MTETLRQPTVSQPTMPQSTNAATDAPALDTEALLKVLLDEDRLAILGLTAQRAQTVRELAAALPTKRTPPAKHVTQLLEANLLVQVGAESYALNVRQLQQWKRELFARPSAPTPESTEAQILATFVRGGKMVQYPAQQSKRLVLLRWLASHFEEGRAYPEREVNEVLTGHSEDHATLRRFLIDAEFLVRHNGVYRRNENRQDEPAGEA